MSENHRDRKVEIVNIEHPVIQEIIKYYSDEHIDGITFTEREMERIIRYAQSLNYGTAVWVPLICTGQALCVYKHVCPIIDKAPLGKKCIWEMQAVQKWFDDYVQSLEVDTNDKIERSQIMELVEADILNARASAVLGREGFVMENPVGTNPDTGETIFHKELHIAMQIKEKAQFRRDRIMKAFIATRDSKVKSMKGMVADSTEYFAKLREKAAQIVAKHEAVTVEAKPSDTSQPVPAIPDTGPGPAAPKVDEGETKDLW